MKKEQQKQHLIDMMRGDEELGLYQLDYSKIKSIEFDGIDYTDAPDYCDAYIVSAEYDGEGMTEEQIESLNDDRDFVYQMLMEYLN
jgi:hypothetical protein